MIVKSMSRKSMSFAQLLRYIDGPEEKGAPLLHNFGAAVSLNQIRQELISNAHLLPPRKNGNVLFHEVLSFANGDREHLSAGVLLDLTRRYLELRAPYALGYARAHFDTRNPHVHLVISANNVGSSQRLRWSKKEFRQIQWSLERYQRQRYPLLTRSLAQQPRPRQVLRGSRSEQERQRRGESLPSRKQAIRDLVQQELSSSWSGPEVYRRLLQHGLRLYRRGSSIGVEDTASARRYRLKTLGLAEAFEHARQSWGRVNERAVLSRKRSRDPPDQYGPSIQR